MACRDRQSSRWVINEVLPNMLAYFMPGPFESLIILVIGLVVFGVPIAILVLLVVHLRKQSSGDTSPSDSQLRDESPR